MVGLCLVGSCGEPQCARGLCRFHYDLKRRTGSVRARVMRRLCPSCGVFFAPSRKDKLFCSARCRVAWFRRRASDWRLGERPDTGLFVDEVSQSAVPVSVGSSGGVTFTDRDVVAAHGLHCRVCGKRIDVHAGLFAPLSLASQWLVPLDDGGEPVLANRVPVHYACKGGVPDGRKQA